MEANNIYAKQDNGVSGRLCSCTVGKPDSFKCQYCTNRNTTPTTQRVGECNCCGCKDARIGRWNHQLRETGLGDAFIRHDFLTYMVSGGRQAWLKGKASQYAENPDGWLVMCGAEGTGKTHLGIAVCNRRVLLGDEAHYFLWPDDMAQIYALHSDSQRRIALLKHLKSVRLLFIDDFMKMEKFRSRRTAYLDMAIDILYARYVKKLPTIIATKLNLAQLFSLDEDIAQLIAIENAHVLLMPNKAYPVVN